ncbi:MAG TPA: hypothetical protein VK956_16510 [Verrucomicrobium sp.]|nr:hypothetical protein [Verrucomicrobium sp.]
MVATFALLMLLGVAMVFRGSLLRRDQAAKAQLRADYREREDAVLRSLVAIFPKKAIACMKAGYVPSDAHDWNSIFNEALATATVDKAIPDSVVTAMGLSRVRRGDVGDASTTEAAGWITSLTGTPGAVTPGTTAYASVFLAPAFAGKVPPLLQLPSSLSAADAARPIVSIEKTYAFQDPGVLASISTYPRYNLVPYPNIRFGYATPGTPFVAKRNWWAFTVHYGVKVGQSRHYVLSLYEVPSQLPIESGTFADIGRHADGTAWGAGITIDGGVYADSLHVDGGAHGASRLAGRRAINLENGVDLAGLRVTGDFDKPGERERMQAELGTHALPVALSANSGRVVFFPIPTGASFLNRPSGTSTAWESYVGGGRNCRVSVEALAMVSYEDQTPVALRVRFQNPASTVSEVTLRRGQNWPTILEDGGDVVPFQTELTNTGRSCVTFYPALVDSWLQSQGGAPVAVNASFHFSTNAAVDPVTVHPFSSPPADQDMCVIVRKGKDLTAFSAGLSLVTPLRVYIGDDLNAQPAAAPPAGSGLPASAVFYPPMSIFAAEMRVGTTPFNRPFEHHGQMGSLLSGPGMTWRPLDMKSGTDEAVHSDSIEAELAPLRSPAELPPIHQMNWLVVIEEIPPT